MIEKAQYNRPFLGERVSGDLPIIHEDETYLYVALVDALGHGEEAHKMSATISVELQRCWSSDPANIISDINDRIDKSIGAAIGVLVIGKNKLNYVYSGLGNVCCKIIDSKSSANLTSSDGILGMRYRTSRNHRGSLGVGDILVMCSDGISGLDNVQNWQKYGPLKCSSIVRRIVNEYGTDLDDSSCIAIKIN
jgi:serine/threonine protein phosphatase PrpC